ncbi:MAG: signal peptidase II [Rhodospirillaceae bacterium]|jgi:signal peptidase II|nr:signal peptidase II [Rhodospirillaceae bacterium]MBT3629403.1 signal peptidase II [Rhodospirillaceae bacterium]MBT3928885.1 signal peptidase II [Rhodospirillaceae bacterium]MBT4427040.1 signal peptidase II [Rhodospirillaceae bacterium]MBT5039091.1 signal peptidase II [Rhodospirillaceae bacterium]
MIRLGAPLAALALILDQLTKWLARDNLWDPPIRVEVLGFLDLVPVENRGISFGLLQSEGGLGVWLISAFALIVAAGLGFWLYRTRRKWPALALGLIIGGALGNVIDRLRLGWVIDFIDFHVNTWHWPAFNIADAAITVGVGMLLIDGLFGTAKKPK